ATLLARCKMAEVEEKVAKEGWPGDLIEGHDECCEEGAHDGFTCDWKVERIKLPDAEEDEDTDKETDKAKDGKSGAGGKGGGVLDALAGMSKQGSGDQLSGIANMFPTGNNASSYGLTDSSKKKSDRDSKNPDGKDRPKSDEISGSESDPMSSMVMTFAFPMLKPVIEEGTRRASVVVHWKEGSGEHQFEVVQFMVSEAQIILPDLDSADGGVAGGMTTTPGGAQLNPQAPTTKPAAAAK
ncbi:MAG: ral secretion pathway protein, partial [Myxococcaceae bacterium]|nr:ral secretion pathway protein [Myxococcaceae bacterium]